MALPDRRRAPQDTPSERTWRVLVQLFSHSDYISFEELQIQAKMRRPAEEDLLGRILGYLRDECGVVESYDDELTRYWRIKPSVRVATVAAAVAVAKRRNCVKN